MLDTVHYFTVSDRKGSKHSVLNLTLDEFRGYEQQGINAINPFPDKDLLVYQTENGKIICREHDMAALFPSLEIFKDYVQSLPKNSARAMMYNKNPFGKEFPKQVDSLVSSMLTDFGISTAGKSQTEILKALDKIIVKKRTIDSSITITCLLSHLLANRQYRSLMENGLCFQTKME